MTNPFRVALSRDLLDSRDKPSFGSGQLKLLDDQPDVFWEFLPGTVPAITAEDAAQFDALYVALEQVNAATVARPDCRLKLVARHGVGFDTVEVAAMTHAGVMVTNTPPAVRRPVATMAITFLLALSHKLVVKDRLVRTGRWNERTDHMGVGLTGRTLGVIGAGGIGKELLRMIRMLDMRVLAADPNVPAEAIAALDANKVELDALMRESDFVIVACQLDESTRKLIDARRLGLMKPGAYLINVARGPIVDEGALYEALAARRIAGAALDVFEQEPTPSTNPILALDNVLLSPHALCWTDEMFRNIAECGLQSVVDVAQRRRPQYLVNAAVVDHPRVKAWLRT